MKASKRCATNSDRLGQNLPLLSRLASRPSVRGSDTHFVRVGSSNMRESRKESRHIVPLTLSTLGVKLTDDRSVSLVCHCHLPFDGVLRLERLPAMPSWVSSPLHSRISGIQPATDGRDSDAGVSLRDAQCMFSCVLTLTRVRGYSYCLPRVRISSSNYEASPRSHL